MNVSDDAVLQAMSVFGLEADDLHNFRYFRHLMEEGVPVCCIAFMYFYVEHVPNMSDARMDAILTGTNRRGRKLDMAVALLAHQEYFCNACDAADHNLNYTPCPACVLAKRFVEVEGGCPCCADTLAHPSPENDVA